MSVSNYLDQMHLENYGIYADLVTNRIIIIKTADINDNNIDIHFNWILNILKDGLEREEIQTLKIHVIFTDNVELDMFIIDYMYNLMFWSIITVTNRPLSSFYFYPSMLEPHTKNNMKKWIDNKFIRPNIKNLDMIDMNQAIDRSQSKYIELENFQMWLANTTNLEDTIELMNKYPDFNETIHFDPTGIPLEDVKDEGMKAANVQINYIKNSDHCLKDAFLAGEGINAKQYKEVSVNIGSKPNGQGGVFPHAIQGSFINGGLRNPEEIIVESSIGRIAQILQKQNVGQSGAFARNLGLNNLDSKLHEDPNYICDTKNFEEITIENSDMLDEYDMRYYRMNKNGIDYLINANTDKFLIGKKIFLRSPMTCASAARGEGVCYRCYGDLAYVVRDINIGQIASELLSSVYTQILLSAKHLLESAIVKMQWTDGFFDLFNVEFNQVTLKDDFNYRGYKLIIEDIFDDEDGEDDLNSYIMTFVVQYPDGHRVTMKTSDKENDYDNIYIHQDLYDYLDSVGTNDEEIYEIEFTKLKDLSALFVIDVKNNELSKTMKSIKNIIDNKKSTKSYNRNNILEDFVKTNLSGNIKMNSVHFEILLMNQIRNAQDILELPDWSKENEECQILTLNEALSNNRSISVRLQASKIAKSITHPENRRLHKASNMDLFYMEKPQEFMTDEYQVSTYKPKEIRESVKVNPIYYIDDITIGEDEDSEDNSDDE